MNLGIQIRQLLAKGINYKLIRAYKECFGSEAGKIVLHDLAVRFKLADVCETPLDEGGRRVLLHIITLLELRATDFSQIYKQGEE